MNINPAAISAITDKSNTSVAAATPPRFSARLSRKQDDITPSPIRPAILNPTTGESTTKTPSSRQQGPPKRQYKKTPLFNTSDISKFFVRKGKPDDNPELPAQPSAGDNTLDTTPTASTTGTNPPTLEASKSTTASVGGDTAPVELVPYNPAVATAISSTTFNQVDFTNVSTDAANMTVLPTSGSGNGSVGVTNESNVISGGNTAEKVVFYDAGTTLSTANQVDTTTAITSGAADRTVAPTSGSGIGGNGKAIMTNVSNYSGGVSLPSATSTPAIDAIVMENATATTFPPNVAGSEISAAQKAAQIWARSPIDPDPFQVNDQLSGQVDVSVEDSTQPGHTTSVSSSSVSSLTGSPNAPSLAEDNGPPLSRAKLVPKITLTGRRSGSKSARVVFSPTNEVRTLDSGDPPTKISELSVEPPATTPATLSHDFKTVFEISVRVDPHTSQVQTEVGAKLLKSLAFIQQWIDPSVAFLPKSIDSTAPPITDKASFPSVIYQLQSHYFYFYSPSWYTRAQERGKMIKLSAILGLNKGCPSGKTLPSD
jgi:hypothetical protein